MNDGDLTVMDPLKRMFRPRSDGRRLLSMVCFGHHQRTETWDEHGQTILYHYEGDKVRREIYRSPEEFAAVPPEQKCWSGTHLLDECTCQFVDKNRTYADFLRRQRGMEESRWFILPEFCEGSYEGFFRGWHLYLRQRTDGSRNDDGDWGWIRHPSDCFYLQSFLIAIGAPRFHAGYELTGWFAATFPKGLEVRPDRVPCPSRLTLAGAAPVWQQALPFAQSLPME